MPPPFHGAFSRRGPDVLTEALATLLSGPTSFEFKPLFSLLYADLRARKLATGGEEMCRLRVYERLQALVDQGKVARGLTGGIKEYSGLAGLAALLPIPPTTGASSS